jgi:agmatine deiminase
MREFIMPAEWETHEATWLAWPHDRLAYLHSFENVEKTFVSIIKALHTSEQVNLLVLDEKMKEYVLRFLRNAAIDESKIKFYLVEYADIWIRDYGPNFVKEKNTDLKSFIKWRYNAYGDKFKEILKDDEVFVFLAKEIKAPMVSVNVVMEGGSLEINGKGTLVTTEQCLLNPTRNPTLSREDIEKYLNQYLGIKKTIWLKKGLLNDHTDGHVDDIVKFVDEHTVFCGYEEDATHPNYVTLNENYLALKNATDQDGKAFEVIKIPMPHLLYDSEIHSEEASAYAGLPAEAGSVAPASYLNFYIANTVILVPIFNDPNDAKALEIIASKFPTRKVVGINAIDLVYGGGAIHCMTQQEPEI